MRGDFIALVRERPRDEMASGLNGGKKKGKEGAT